MVNLKDNKDRVWRKIIIFLSKESNKKKQVLKKKKLDSCREVGEIYFFKEFIIHLSKKNKLFDSKTIKMVKFDEIKEQT